MKMRIEEKEAFAVFGVEKPIGDEPGYRDFWTQAYQSGLYQKLHFDAGGARTPDEGSPGMGVLNGMGNFEAMGDYMISLFHRAYKRWLQRSGYARAPGPDMEIYYVTENGKHRDEIWIPVKKIS